jgi:SSS family solute:Na+ symporter
MLKVLNLPYYLLGQLVPGWLTLLFLSLCAGMGGVDRHRGWSRGLPGAVQPRAHVGWFNAGLVAVGVNLLLVFGLSALRPAQPTRPMSQWTPGTDKARTEQSARTV